MTPKERTLNTALVSGTVALMLTLLLMTSASESVRGDFDAALLQEMNPEKVGATIKANVQALKAFSHQQRTQLKLKGETKKVILNLISYDINGNELKTQLSEDPPPDSSESSGGGRRGRLKGAIVAKKKGEFKEMMQGITTLIKSYTELPPDQLQVALKKAILSPGEGEMAGSVQIQMRSVIHSGDSMTIWIDRTSMLFRRVAIAATYEENPVTTIANYSMLTSGEVYMAQAILNYPKKELVVEIDNMNYQRTR